MGVRDYKEATARYDGKCFACGEIVRKGQRCFLAPPNGRRYWGVCCWECGLARGWVAVEPAQTYDAEPVAGYWWNRYD